MTGRAYIHGRSTDTNLAEIHEEMRELLDKQVNVQKESLKKLPGFMQAPTSPRKKCAMKMKEKKNEEKNDSHIKIFVVKGRTSLGRIRRMAEAISMKFGLLILQTMKVLILY